MIRYWLCEYKYLAKNPAALLILVGAIVIYSFLYPVPYWNNTVREVPVSVVDQDNSQLSRMLVRMMDATEQVKVHSRPANIESAQREFAEGKVMGYLLIPQDFQRNIKRGEQVTVSGFYDMSVMLFYKQVKTALTYASRTLGASIQIKRLVATGQSRERAMKSYDPVPFVGISLFNPSGSYGPYILPGVFLLFIHQTLIISIGIMGGFYKEIIPPELRHKPTLLERLEMIVGRSMAYLTVSCFTGIYLLAMMHLFYGLALRGREFDLLMLYIPFIISSTFLGLTIAPLFVTREIALVALLCTSVPNVFLAGFSWPPESMPRLLRLFSLAVPNSTGVDAYLRITQMGADRYDVEWQIRHLWILSAVYFVTALLMSRFAVALPKDPLPCDQQVPTTEAFPETSVS